jgi:hypothetical protein
MRRRDTFTDRHAFVVLRPSARDSRAQAVCISRCVMVGTARPA